MNKQQLKQALISILIGAAISFLTVLFQGLLDYRGGIKESLPGVISGMVYYIAKQGTRPIG